MKTQKSVLPQTGMNSTRIEYLESTIGDKYCQIVINGKFFMYVETEKAAQFRNDVIELIRKYVQ